MGDIEKNKNQIRAEKSKEALKRLNDFSYLDKRQEKNRAKNEKLRQEEEATQEQERKIARPGSPDPQI